MTDKRFTYKEDDLFQLVIHDRKDSVIIKDLIHAGEKLNKLHEENQRIHNLLNNRIKELNESLDKLKNTPEDLNQQAVEDVAIILTISINALKEFKKELQT